MNLSGIFYTGTGSYWDDSYSSVGGGKYALAGGVGAENLLLAPYAGNKPVTVPTGVLDRWNGAQNYAVGSTLPRDALKGLPLYKMDLRLSRDFKFHERATFTPMVEVFNLFNHPNYGSYQTVTNLAGFGNPVQNTSVSYVPREIQFAFRASF